LLIFYGTERAEDPVPWIDGNPYTHLGANPDLKVRLVQGSLDLLVPAGFAVMFDQALDEAGYDVELTIIEGGNHRSVVDPEADGDRVVSAVLEVADQDSAER
jgi:acetyl esterase/lipase